MTRLQQAIALRGVTIYRLAAYLSSDPASAGLPRVGVAPVSSDRLHRMLVGLSPTNAEAVALGRALDLPPGFFQRPDPEEPVSLFACRLHDRVTACACGRVALYLCDAPAPPNGLATCDRPLCGACAVRVDVDTHRCRECEL